MRVQMLGLCRFSYLGMRGFQREHETLEERRAFLYDPERLKRRWFWFKHVALPAWTAQTDPDFTLVIMTGPDLPQPWLDRLHKLVEKYPQFRLALVPPEDWHRTACRKAVAPHIDPSADIIGHFRHDDDDAVGFDYVARARADFADARSVWARHGQLCVDHARGLMVSTKGGQVEITPRHCFNMGVAMTVFTRPDPLRSALDFEHWKVPATMPNLSIDSPLMFLRLIHDDSDSGAVGGGIPVEMPDTDWAALLRDRFGVDYARLAEGARRFG